MNVIKVSVMCFMLAWLIMALASNSEAGMPTKNLAGDMTVRVASGQELRTKPLQKLASGQSGRENRGGTLDNMGGPDGYGYHFIDNQSGDTATYAWIELSDDPGTIWVNSWNGTHDDAYSADYIPFGFSFPFYSESYDHLTVSTNGFIEFTTTSYPYQNETLPSSQVGGPAVYLYWDDLHLDNGGVPSGTNVVGYQNFGNYTVVEFNRVGFYEPSCSGSSLTFEAIFYPNGRIKLQYNTIQAGSCANSQTIGIQSDGAPESYALTYVADAMGYQPTAGLAIWFANGSDVVPNAITDLTIQYLPESNEVALRWSAAEGADMYQIWGSNADTSASYTAMVGSTPGLSQVFTCNTPDTRYFFYVVSVNTNSLHTSSPSNVVGYMRYNISPNQAYPFGLAFQFWNTNGGNAPVFGEETFRPSEIVGTQPRCGTALTAHLIVRQDNGRFAWRDSINNCSWRGYLETQEDMRPATAYWFVNRSAVSQRLILAGQTDHDGNYGSVTVTAPIVPPAGPWVPYSWRDSRVLGRDQLNLLESGILPGTGATSDRVIRQANGTFLYRNSINNTWGGTLYVIDPGAAYFLQNRHAGHTWVYDYRADGAQLGTRSAGGDGPRTGESETLPAPSATGVTKNVHSAGRSK